MALPHREQAGPTLALNTWYYVDVSVDTSGTTWQMRWSVNGGAQTTSSYNVGVTRTTSALAVGLFGSTGTNSIMDFDDVMVTSNLGDYPIGDGNTTSKAFV
jgi:hypothetical protein